MEIVYKVRRHNQGRRVLFAPVNGFQVGRFAVRKRTQLDLEAIGRNGHSVPVRQYIVDHINTGIIVIDTDTFDDAVMLADDISRFSKRDPRTRDPNKFMAQLGKDIVEWLCWIIEERRVLFANGNYVNFRDYQKLGNKHASNQTVSH